MASRTTRGRRSWPQRLLIGFNVCVVIGALGAAATFAYVNEKLSDVKRLALSGALTNTAPDPGAPQNFLIVGTDSDLGLDDDDPARQGRGEVTGLRGDTIMILHVDPGARTAELLSLPRDLWVPIAGQGTEGRINSALGLGGEGTAGPATLIATIEQNFDIPINHYLEVDFAGFEKLIAAIDGVPIYFPTGIRDFDPARNITHTAIDIPGPGCYTLDPSNALAYARSRHMQYQRVPGDPSTWTDDGGNDFGRIQRQQDFVQRVLSRAISKGIRDPMVLRELVDVGVSSVQMDDQLTAGLLVKLGRTFRSFDPDELVTSQLPAYRVFVNGADVLKLKMPEAEEVLAPFQEGLGSVDAALRSITVSVHNGTGRSNEATNVARALQRTGFSVGVAADELGITDEASIIRYPDGAEADARMLARHLESEVVFEPIESTWRAESDTVVLVTGTSFTGVLTDARPADAVPGPSTTAPVTSSTTTMMVPDDGDDGDDGDEDPSDSTGPGGSTTSTTSTVPGFLPGPAPPGVDCG